MAKFLRLIPMCQSQSKHVYIQGWKEKMKGIDMRKISFVYIVFLFLSWISILGIAGKVEAGGCDDGLRGWDILTEGHRQLANVRHGLSFQWDYFMVHDDDFTGSIGYVVADPEKLLLGLMPTGGSAAIGGKFLNTDQLSVEYMHFGHQGWTGPGSEGYTASAVVREFYAEKESGLYYARMIPVPAEDKIILQGQTENFQWDLEVTQDWADRCDPDYLTNFGPVTGFDVSKDPYSGQFWTVDMNWMRLHVVGTITNLTTGEILDINGHGYRETAWGPWQFNTSGWDFVVVSDENSIPIGTEVQWSLQTYHHSETLDYLDVSFKQDGELKAERFKSELGELGWYHTDWTFNSEAGVCLPRDMMVLAKNDNYIVEVNVDIGDNQLPLLSDLTVFTEAYTIVVRFAQLTGTIKDANTQEVVATFSGPGGGEFGVPRLYEGAVLTDEECSLRYGSFYTESLPAGLGCVDEDGDGYGLTGGLDCLYPEVVDCNDGNPNANPSQIEIINGIDDNCDGRIDEARGCFIATCSLWN
jgi:hypothetical protein